MIQPREPSSSESREGTHLPREGRVRTAPALLLPLPRILLLVVLLLSPQVAVVRTLMRTARSQAPPLARAFT